MYKAAALTTGRSGGLDGPASCAGAAQGRLADAIITMAINNDAPRNRSPMISFV
jgi:hypothetical protein